MTAQAMDPVHPGEILMLEYIEPLGITQHRVAVAIGVGTSERFWLNLQSRLRARRPARPSRPHA